MAAVGTKDLRAAVTKRDAVMLRGIGNVTAEDKPATLFQPQVRRRRGDGGAAFQPSAQFQPEIMNAPDKTPFAVKEGAQVADRPHLGRA